MGDIYIFGYLSLISKDSASTAVKLEKDAIIPSKLKGFRRNWTSIRKNETELFKRYIRYPSGDLVDYFAWATLLPCRQSEFVNGVCIKVESHELKNLDDREVGYKRYDVTNSITFYNKTFQLKKEDVIYTYIAPESDINPSKSYIDCDYINLGLEGAKEINQFVSHFLIDYQASTPLPVATLAELRQVFWSSCGKRLYLLGKDSSITLLHEFKNYAYTARENIRDRHFDIMPDTKLAGFDLRSQHHHSNSLFYRLTKKQQNQVLEEFSELDDFLVKISLLRNPFCSEEVIKKIISTNNWVVNLIALDMGYKIDSDDSWLTALRRV